MYDDEHHDERYEDGEPYLPLVAANAYREWFDTPRAWESDENYTRA